jgi:hypothetical protein
VKNKRYILLNLLKGLGTISIEWDYVKKGKQESILSMFGINLIKVTGFNTIRNKIKEPKICNFLCMTCIFWPFSHS